jgi:hypothetical protein
VVAVKSGDDERDRVVGLGLHPGRCQVFSLLDVIQCLPFFTTYVFGAEPIVLYSDLLMAAGCADTMCLIILINDGNMTHIVSYVR